MNLPTTAELRLLRWWRRLLVLNIFLAFGVLILGVVLHGW